MTTKYCIGCKKELPEENFYQLHGKPHGRCCRDCSKGTISLKNKTHYDKNQEKMNDKNKKYYQDNKRDWHERVIKSKHKMSKEEYQRLYTDANSSCQICGTPEIELQKKLCIDHSHITEEVRGLLCHKCNTAIGMFFDDPNLIEKAALYLRQHDASFGYM